MDGRRERPVGWLLAGILFGPPAVMSAYLGLSRWPTRWFTEASDWVGMAAAVGVGVVCIWRLPLPAPARAVLAVLYVPVAGFLLLLYALNFVGVVFGDWL